MKLNTLTLAILAVSSTALAQDQEHEHEHPDPTEVITITANPLGKTALESTQPVSIISGDELKQKHSHSLGRPYLLSQELITRTLLMWRVALLCVGLVVHASK